MLFSRRELVDMTSEVIGISTMETLEDFYDRHDRSDDVAFATHEIRLAFIVSPLAQALSKKMRAQLVGHMKLMKGLREVEA